MFLCSLLTFAQFSGAGNGTENDPYKIYNENQLYEVRNFLNQEGVVFILMKDIDLTNWIADNSPNQGWEPIGVAGSSFMGVFYGNNHTIKGLNIRRKMVDYVGLFGMISGATIQDLTIDCGSIVGNNYVGSLIGQAEASTITNIKVKLSKDEGVTGKENIGGLFGKAIGSMLTGCHVIVNSQNGVSGTANVGGFGGNVLNCAVTDFSVSADVKAGDMAGGLMGIVEDGTYQNAAYIGDVIATAGSGGGFAAKANGFDISEISITSNVSCTGEACYAGGFIAIGEGVGKLKYCTIIGDISAQNAESSAGGGLGGFVGAIKGGSSISFESCFSKGRMTNSSNYTGGIVGMSEGACVADMESCSHFGDIKGKDYVGGLIGAIVSSDEKPHLYTYEIWTDTQGIWIGGRYKVLGPAGSCLYTLTEDVYSGSATLAPINNCTCIGNIDGKDWVGGLIGSDLSSYGYSPQARNVTWPCSGENLFFKDDVWIGTVSYANHYNNTITDYSRNQVSLSITNNYFSGNIHGANYIGGLVGLKGGGELKYNYSYATVYGTKDVGGIVGCTNAQTYNDCSSVTIIKSNVANCQVISATSSNLGRIYGSIAGDEYTEIGALGSAEGNRALAQTKLVLQGVIQEFDDDLQNGTSIGPYTLKLKGNYVSWGWDFDNDWNILETESYPYKKYQAAPPVVYEDLLVSKATTISGKSLNDGTVYMYYKNRDAVSTVSNGHEWVFSTEPLQSGAQVRVYADVEGMTPSYFATSFVKYPGSGTEEDPYRIYSAEDLQGASNRGYYKLMNDVDLTSWINENSPTEGWPAIGRNSGEITYIDGDNHKVTGLWINTKENYNGLFSNFSAGHIKNLTVTVASGKKVKGGDFTGILIGRNANGKIINCTVSGDVDGTVHTGGVAGCVLASTIHDVLFNGSVASAADDMFVGGLTGQAEDCTISNCDAKAVISLSGGGGKAGGLIGESKGGTIQSSKAQPTLTATGENYYIGGLIGYSETPVTICTSDGSVSATGDDSYAGGLIGYTTSAIDNCYSTTKTTGTLYSAGLVGYTFNKIDKCYAKGDVYGSRYGAGVVGVLHGPQAVLTNSVACNNIVSLSAGSSWGCRVIGNFNNGALDPDESNYALSTMQVSLNNVPKTITDDNVEGIAKTQEMLQKQNTYELLGWDFTDVWEIDEGRGYPTLQAVVISDDGGEDNPINPDGPETVYVTDIAALSDAIYAESISSQSGTEATLTIYLKNAKAATAYSFDLLLPKGVSMVKDNNGDYQYTLSNRHNGHSETVNYQSGTGFYSMAVVSLQTKEVKGNDGAIWTIKLKIADNVANGDYAIKISNAKYSLTSGSSKVNMPETISKLTICQYVKGDVNSDGDVDIADVVCIINHVVGLPTPSFVEQAADANGDGDVDIADAVRIINFVVGKINALSRGNGSLARAVTRAGDVTDAVSIDDASVFVGKDGTLTVSLKNAQTTSAYSFDLVLPEGVSILQDGDDDYLFELSDRHNGHTGILNYKGDNTYGFAVASMQSKEVKGNDGAICTFKLKVDNTATIGKQPVIIQNAKYSLTSGASKVTLPEATGQLTIKKLGDANGDGDVTEADVEAVAKHIMGQTPTGFDKEAADVNGDKVVNVADIVEIVKMKK